MNNPETVTEAFIQWLEQEGIGTFGTDIYSPQIPEDAPDAAYWLQTAGGGVVLTLATGEKVKQYFVTINYRSRKGKEVERKLFDLENLINKPQCLKLTGFEVYEVSATQFPVDNDLDDEDRRIGFVQANIQIYKKD